MHVGWPFCSVIIRSKIPSVSLARTRRPLPLREVEKRACAMVTQDPVTPVLRPPRASNSHFGSPLDGGIGCGGLRACVGAGKMKVENKLDELSGREASPGRSTTLKPSDRPRRHPVTARDEGRDRAVAPVGPGWAG